MKKWGGYLGSKWIVQYKVYTLDSKQGGGGGALKNGLDYTSKINMPSSNKCALNSTSSHT